MTTSIEQSLLNAAHNGNLAKVQSIVKDLTAAQIRAFDPSTFGDVERWIAFYSEEKPYNSVETTRIFMEKLGSHVDAESLGEAMSSYAGSGVFKGISVLTDFLTPQIKSELGELG